MTLKIKKSGQRACDEKDAKGELCCGHLKLWDGGGEDLRQQVGPGVSIYRCERCHALYRPAPEDHSSAGSNFEERRVDLLGMFKKNR